LYSLARPFLFSLDTETSHAVGLRSLQVLRTLQKCVGLEGRVPPQAAPTELFGLKFANRIGLAAGADKNAQYIDALGGMGFGFIEVGTMTPLPQPGRDKPRLFRLPDQLALINRMGFPNEGVEAIAARIERRTYAGIVGANISVNAATPIERFTDDFITCFRRVCRISDYIAINISSPNTKNLRDMHDEARLRDLFARLFAEREARDGAGRKPLPILMKISPDLDEHQLAAMAHLALELRVDGLIATNTTVGRTAIPNHPLAGEAGGLSGHPLLPLALSTVARLRKLVGSGVAIVGVGGVLSADDYARMREAGADLVQVYTGLVYRGPGLVKEILRRERRT
jgi:dihydroorotate dehydrogenase